MGLLISLPSTKGSQKCLCLPIPYLWVEILDHRISTCNIAHPRTLPLHGGTSDSCCKLHPHPLPASSLYDLCPLACSTSLGRDPRLLLPTPLTPASCLGIRLRACSRLFSKVRTTDPNDNSVSIAACQRIVGPSLQHVLPL